MSFSLQCLGLIAQNTLREAVRQRLFALLLVLALGLVVAAQGLRDLNVGAAELKFIADLGWGAIGGCGAVLTVTATAQLFFSELENRTVLVLLARPVRRAEFILGKYLGVLAIVAIYCAVLTALLAVVLWARETALRQAGAEAWPAGAGVQLPWLVATGVLLGLKLALLGALTLLVASYARSQTFAVTMGFLGWAVGHLQFLAEEASVRAGSLAVRGVAGLLGRMLPNLQVFAEAGLAADAGGVAWDFVGRAALYALGHVMACCALAVVSFDRREI